MYTWKQSRNIIGTLCNSYTRRVVQFHGENIQKTIERCVPHNVITSMGHHWPKRKQQNWVSTSKRWRNMTGTLRDSHARRLLLVPLRGPINKMREKENCDSPHNITMRMVISDSKVSNKVKCPFGNNRKTL